MIATIDTSAIEPRVREFLARHPAVGMAVGIVRGRRLEYFHAHGLANIAANTPITVDTIFRVASISKTFTAIAVMQLYEQGLVDLDAPANDYLRAFKLVPASPGFRPATLRHLLTHTAGIGEEVHLSDAFKRDFGESFELSARMPSLSEFYGGALRIEADPGTRFIYTDHGFAVAGQVVEDVSGQPLDRYLRERIFEPLGMAHTDLLRSELVMSRLATGYVLTARGPRPVTDRRWVTAAASAVNSSPADMALYISALLGGGANEHGSVLKPETLATMFAPQYSPDPRVPGMGLAFSRFDIGGHLAVEHEGVLPGFNSQIFVAPDDGVGVMAFTNGARQAMLWLPGEVSSLLQHLLGAPDPVVRTDVPQHPDRWPDLCGWYHLSARITDARARMMMGAGAHVFVRRGRLMVRILSPIPALLKGFELHPDDPDDPDVFRIDLTGFGIGTARVVFGRDAAGRASRAQLELMPMALEKRSN